MRQPEIVPILKEGVNNALLWGKRVLPFLMHSRCTLGFSIESLLCKALFIVNIYEYGLCFFRETPARPLSLFLHRQKFHFHLKDPQEDKARNERRKFASIARPPTPEYAIAERERERTFDTRGEGSQSLRGTTQLAQKNLLCLPPSSLGNVSLHVHVLRGGKPS